MKIGISTVVLSFLFTLLCVSAAQAQQPVDQSYRLGAGDEVEIRVYGENDLTVRTRLGDSGSINYPFLGEVMAKGLTVGELEQLITKGLKGPYLVNPAVSVHIMEYRPFFVNGEVSSPGAIPYQPGITLRKAVAMAGGFTERANRSSAELLRGNEIEARNIKLDEQIRPGDIITVKQSFF